LRQFWLLRRYLRQRHVDKGLSTRIIKFLEHHVNNIAKLVQKEKIPVMGALSEALQNELTHHMHAPLLKGHIFFMWLNGKMPMVMHRLCRLVLKLQSFAEKEVAFSTNDEAKTMLFIKKGDFAYSIYSVEELDPPLRKGDWLCEAVLYTPWRHRGDLTAVVESEAIELVPDSFQQVMSIHPRPWNYAQKYAEKFVEMLATRPDVHDVIRDTCWYEETVATSDEDYVAPANEEPFMRSTTSDLLPPGRFPWLARTLAAGGRRRKGETSNESIVRSENSIRSGSSGGEARATSKAAGVGGILAVCNEESASALSCVGNASAHTALPDEAAEPAVTEAMKDKQNLSPSSPSQAAAMQQLQI